MKIELNFNSLLGEDRIDPNNFQSCKEIYIYNFYKKYLERITDITNNIISRKSEYQLKNDGEKYIINGIYIENFGLGYLAANGSVYGYISLDKSEFEYILETADPRNEEIVLFRITKNQEELIVEEMTNFDDKKYYTISWLLDHDDPNLIRVVNIRIDWDDFSKNPNFERE